MAKWYAAELAVKVVDEAVQLHRGYGCFADYGIERFYRAIKEIEKVSFRMRYLEESKETKYHVEDRLCQCET